MKKLLLHVCCAPCSTEVIHALSADYDITLFFYNPNIEPISEYEKRLKEIERYAEIINLPLVVWDYNNIDWRNAVQGKESAEEGGERCTICFAERLKGAAQYAKMNGFDIFTTTLTVSPMKDSNCVNSVGKDIGKKLGIEFLEADFKKNGGYMRSIELSKKYNLYRQGYCGCLFSKR